jgi:tetratricopeptide (TPR) repeat protein
MDINDFQLPPPKEWGKFEDLCLTLYREQWGDPDAQKNGRRGQAQHGVDISGRPQATPGEVHGVQCKGKDNNLGAVVTKIELEEEVAKALTFQPPLAHWTLVTTAPKDATIEREARLITQDHLAKSLFSVTVLGWEDLTERITDSDAVMAKHYPDLAPRQKVLLAEVQAVYSESREQTTSIQALRSESLDFQATMSAGMARLLALAGGVPQGAPATDAREVVLHARIDDARASTNEGEPASALRQLDRLIAAHWAEASEVGRFRLLANKAAALFALGRNEEGAQLSMDAYGHAPSDPRAVVFAAQAHLFRGEAERARGMLDPLLQADPANSDAQALRIAASVDEAAVTDPFWIVPNRESAASNVILSAARWLRSRGRHDESMEAFRAALRSNPDQPEVLADAASCTLENLFRDRAAVFAHRLDAAQQASLLQAVDQLRVAWGKVKTTQVGSTYLWAFSNLINALRYLDLLQEASDLLTEADALLPQRPELLQPRILVEAALGRHAEVLTLLDRLGSDDSEARVMRSDALDALGRHAEALAALDGIADTATPRLLMAAAGSRVKLLVALGRKDEAGTVSDAALAAFPDYALARLVRSDAYRRLGNPELALRHAHEAAAVVDRSPTGDGLDMLITAEALGQLGDWDGAATLLGDAGNVEADSAPLRQRVLALLNSGRRQELRALLASMPDRVARLPPYARAATWLYRLSGDYVAARTHCEVYLEQVPGDLGMRMIWLDVLERQDDRQAIEGFLSGEVDGLGRSGGTRDLMALAQFMVRHGHPEQAVDLGYRTLRERWSKPKAHLGYFGLMMGSEDARAPVPNPTSIGPGVAFTVQDETGQRRTYTIETASDLKPEFNEIAPGSRLALAAAGLRVGDMLRVNDNDLMHQQLIVELVHKSLGLLHRSLREFNGLFPDNNSLIGFNVDTAHPERFIETLRPALAAKAASGQALLQQYQTTELPIAFAGRVVGLDPVDGWSFIRQGKVPLDVCRGLEAERDEVLRLLKPHPQLVVEPMTFWIAGVLGILDELTATFGPLGLTATTLELLQKREREARDNLARGSGVLTQHDGRVIMVQATEAEKRIPAEFASKMVAWVKANAVIVSAIPVVDVGADFRELGEMTHPSILDTVVAASGSGRVLLCEDRRLRELARSVGVVDLAWLQPAMLVAVAGRQLQRVRYSDALLDMCLWGHRLTSIDGEALLRATVRWGADSPRMFDEVVNSLASPSLEPRSLRVVLLAFIKDLWSQPRARTTKERYTAAALRACQQANPACLVFVAGGVDALAKGQGGRVDPIQAQHLRQASRYIRQWMTARSRQG